MPFHDTGEDKGPVPPPEEIEITAGTPGLNHQGPLPLLWHGMTPQQVTDAINGKPVPRPEEKPAEVAPVEPVAEHPEVHPPAPVGTETAVPESINHA